MSLAEKIGLIYLAVVNLAAFFLYGLDKWKATRKKWRIPERVLLGSAVLGGGLGALLGMKIWHHKTRKVKFMYGVPVCLVAWSVVLVRIWWLA